MIMLPYHCELCSHTNNHLEIVQFIPLIIRCHSCHQFKVWASEEEMQKQLDELNKFIESKKLREEESKAVIV